MIVSDIAIERIRSCDLSPAAMAAVREVCDAAYGCATQPFFDAIGPGEHLLGHRDGRLVSHLMWVRRRLQVGDDRALDTAYVELVATEPAEQRKGHASTLLEALVPLLGDYELAALCPATEGLYARTGWQFWRGDLYVRKDGALVATPGERVMVLPLPQSPVLDLERSLSVEWREGEVW